MPKTETTARALKSRTVPRHFFDQPADEVARALLGMRLCIQTAPRTVVRLPIVETEAYIGAEDLANHASRGRTGRTEPMFGSAGTIYVYLVYGMYHMFNVVTGPRDYPAAVLIRGAGGYDGPGKLTRALNIGMSHNAEQLGRGSGVWIEHPAAKPRGARVVKTPRIGVSYAGAWAQKPLRFVLMDKDGKPWRE